MKACTLYYDSDSIRCSQFARKLAAYNKAFSLVPAGSPEPITFNANEAAGFIFISTKGRPDPQIERIMRNIVMGKNGYIFILILGGTRTLTTIKHVHDLLSSRGMRLANAYTESSLKKISPDEDAVFQKISVDVQDEVKVLDRVQKEVESLPTAEIRKLMHQYIRDYLKEQRHSRHHKDSQ